MRIGIIRIALSFGDIRVEQMPPRADSMQPAVEDIHSLCE